MRPLIIFGPSGVGKGTIINSLKDRHPSLFELATSFTTRQPRPGEQHGKHYFFVSRQQFDAKVANNETLQHKTVFGNSYATSKENLNQIVLLRKKIPILDVDIKGMKDIRESLIKDIKQAQQKKEARQQAKQYKQNSKNQSSPLKPLGLALCLCILPPSYTLLKQRLTNRKSQSQSVVNKRMTENLKQIECMLKLQQNNWPDLYFITNYQYQLSLFGIQQWLYQNHTEYRKAIEEQILKNGSSCS